MDKSEQEEREVTGSMVKWKYNMTILRVTLVKLKMGMKMIVYV